MAGYETGDFYDEVFVPLPGGEVAPRSHYRALDTHLAAACPADLRRASDLANRSFLHQGVTFTVYSDAAQGTERIFPFDLDPAAHPGATSGTASRPACSSGSRALNLFIHDIYHEQQILHDRVVPRRLSCAPGTSGARWSASTCPHDRYIHIVGTRPRARREGNYLVLEDNLRSPSGVSYVLANRTAMSRIFPDWFDELGVRPVDHYCGQLLENLREHLAPPRIRMAPGRPWCC